MSYPRYPAYRESGVEWLGEVPNCWHVLPLKRGITSIQTGGTPSSEAVDYFTDGTLDWYTPGDFRDGSLFLAEASKKVSREAISDKQVKLFPTGSVLIVGIGSIGKTGVATRECSANQQINVLLPSSRSESCFLAYYLHSHIDVLISLSNATILGILNQEKTKQILVSFPPVEEQQAIVTFLNRETAKIDALIAKQERLIALLQEKRQALISHAVTKGLDPHAPMKDSGVEWLGEIPAHWDVARLKHVARLESGHTPSRTVPAYWENCTIPWVSLQDVGFLKDNEVICETTDYINELGIANSSARLLPKGTVVLSRDATVGRCALLGREMATSQHFVNWVCGDSLVPEYLLQVFRGPMQQQFVRLTMGATLRTIGMPEVNGFVVPQPPVQEQQAIVEYIRDAKYRLDGLIGKAQQAIALLREHRISLISAAVTGKIDVRNLVSAEAVP